MSIIFRLLILKRQEKSTPKCLQYFILSGYFFHKPNIYVNTRGKRYIFQQSNIDIYVLVFETQLKIVFKKTGRKRIKIANIYYYFLWSSHYAKIFYRHCLTQCPQPPFKVGILVADIHI